MLFKKKGVNNNAAIKREQVMCQNGTNGLENKQNFKIRRKIQCASMFRLFVFFIVLGVVSGQIENDVLTLEDNLDLKVKDDEMLERRRPVNDQEKDILMLGALGRRKGSYQGYGSSQEDDSIMDLLGKSEYLNICFLILTRFEITQIFGEL